MRYGAVVTGDLVVNVVVLNAADDLNVVAAIHGAHAVVDVTGLDHRPGPGWSYVAGTFRPPSPFPSWVWNNTAWEAPIPYPTDGGEYLWDEEQGDWAEVVEPEPEA